MQTSSLGESQPTWPALVFVTSDPRWSTAQADTSRLTRELCQTLEQGFSDKAVVLTVPTPATDAALASFRKKVLTNLRSHAYVLLDAQGQDASVVDFFTAKPLRDKPMILVPLVQSEGGVATTTQGPAGWRMMRTMLIGPTGASKTSLFRAMHDVRRDSRERKGKSAPSRSEVAPSAPLDPGLCRLRPRADCASQQDYETWLLRWARAITSRRVALALAGSGAWGFAHLSLIRALTAAGVPVDIMTSTSSGTLIAAYYAALGDHGLDLIIRRRFRMEGTLGLAVLTTRAMEVTLVRDLGTCEVQNLDVMFYPVSANLTSNQSEILSSGPLAFAARASSSAPGIFGPTSAGGSVYVDGAVSDNLPIREAQFLGGDLVIGSNPFPQESGMRPPWQPWFIPRMVTDLNPLTRVLELDHALSLNFHGAGEQEALGFPLVYEAPAEHHALLSTFDFMAARHFMDLTESTPEFQDVVSGSILAWKSLSAPRDPKASS